LHILADGQVRGAPPPALTSGLEVHVEHAADLYRFKASVAKASATEVILEMPDGLRWRLTPWTPRDQPVGITTTGMYTEDWVVRSQADPAIQP
jgi:hypothetical protein